MSRVGEGFTLKGMLRIPSFPPGFKPLRRCAGFWGGLTLVGVCGCGGGAVQTGSAAATPTAVQSGPQLGYAWKAADETLRPILGVPGSSQMGASVVAATTYVTAASSSAAGIALLIGADQKVYSMSLPNGPPALVGGAGVTAGAGAKIRFSPSGVTAVIYVPGGLTASVLTGLAANSASGPQVRQVAVTGPLMDMATSDAGTVVAVLQGASGGSLNFLPAGGGQQQLATLKGVGGLAFVGIGDNLLAADSVANTLTLVQAVSTSPSVSQLPTANLLKAPVAVGAALSGKWAVVANGGEASVVQVDLTGVAAPQRIACPSQPAVVERLAGNGVFRFNEIGAAPTWIADMTAPSPAMLFIPASQ